jgi:hypothetical protein
MIATDSLKAIDHEHRYKRRRKGNRFAKWDPRIAVEVWEHAAYAAKRSADCATFPWQAGLIAANCIKSTGNGTDANVSFEIGHDGMQVRSDGRTAIHYVF